MIKAGDVNLAMVSSVAEHLGPLRQKVVFLGGAATALLITDEATPEVRATKDVDYLFLLGSPLIWEGNEGAGLRLTQDQLAVISSSIFLNELSLLP